MSRYTIRKIAWIITGISLLIAYLAISTSDFYVMELQQAVPTYVEALELGSLITMAAGVVVVFLTERW